MPNASAIASELRAFADSLDTNPTLELPYAFLYFTCHTREEILGLAKIMPRPFEKSYSGNDIRLNHKTEALSAWVVAPRELTCTLVTPARPAVYDCEPLLSPDQDASLTEVA